ncbi:MAG: hypothetical protein ABR953_01145 [Candidatus Acidiferrales bacterium]|jgi:hypothetical protein
MTTFDWIKHAFEYIGGAQDEPPSGFPATLGNWWFWTIWWAAMALVIYVFSGQSSKFIYIDF